MKGLGVSEIQARQSSSRTAWKNTVLTTILVISLAYLQWTFHRIASVQQIADEFPELPSHCAHVQPIAPKTYIERQTQLAHTLSSLNASAYIAEPSASALFYVNISAETWRLSERPLLVAITHFKSFGGGDDVQANITILTPKFESSRAKLLPIPSPVFSSINYLAWAEHEDPYTTLVNGLGLSATDERPSKPKIFVDGSTRLFIVDGIQAAAPGFQVESPPSEIRLLRERKTPEEIGILKCANEASSSVCVFTPNHSSN
ncbi:hypothetical protein HGRIS_013503 [Hohenbuehelia grisea]|uniref:Uncharacterized protein n=1 Tax=Hohenbuehelia grisea TaxID=104357 RepID=A0ABR3IVU3_9AGAR